MAAQVATMSRAWLAHGGAPSYGVSARPMTAALESEFCTCDHPASGTSPRPSTTDTDLPAIADGPIPLVCGGYREDGRPPAHWTGAHHAIRCRRDGEVNATLRDLLSR